MKALYCAKCMALIKCPECGKEISDRAQICPNCGFPINEYLESKQNEIVEHQKIIKKNNLKEIMSKYYVFNFFDKQISLNKNNVLCAQIHQCIQFSCQKAQEAYFEEYKPLKPSEFTERDLKIVAKHNYLEVVNQCMESIDNLNKMALRYVEDTTLSIDEWIYSPIDFEEYFNDLIDDFHKLKKDSLNIEYELERKTNTVISTYQNGNLIDEVWARNVGGLVVQSIKARAINSITNAFSHSKMRKELNKIQDSRKKFQSDFDNEICKLVMLNSNKLIASIYESLLHYYLEIGILFDFIEFPKNDYSCNELKVFLTDQTRLQSEKINKLYYALVNDPTNSNLYELCIEYLIFKDNDVKEFEKLVKFVFGNVKLISNNRVINYSMDKTRCKLLNFDNYIFESLYDKECYILDKKMYADIIDKFLGERQWYDLNKVTYNYQNILRLGPAKSKIYKQLLNELDNTVKILDSYQTLFSKFMLEALKKIKSDYTIKELLEYQSTTCEDRRFDLLDNEVPIKYYKYGSLSYNKYTHAHGLLITNMRMALTYTYNDEIFYSFYPTKEYVQSYIPTDGSIIWRSPSEINFVNYVSYRDDVRDPYSFKNSNRTFYTDIGVLARKSSSTNVDEFTDLYNILQKSYINKKFNMSISKFQKKASSTVKSNDNNSTIVENSEDNHDKKVDNLSVNEDHKTIQYGRKSDENNDLESKQIKDNESIDKEVIFELKKEYEELIKCSYPDYFDRMNFLENELLDNKNETSKKAFEILLRLSKICKNNSDILYDLGVSYCYGLGVDIDYARAKDIFDKIKLKNPEALYHLSYIYLKDESLFPSSTDWHKMVIHAADKGSVQARIRICIWANGETNGFLWDKDTQKVVYLWRSELAKNGSRLAKRMIVSYCWNHKKKASYDETIKVLLSIIDSHTPNDWVDIGKVYNLLFLYYEEGRATKKDINKAMYYLELAAKNNYCYSQRMIGEYYLKGKYLNKDKEKARYWFTQAAKKGDKKSIKYVEKLNKKSGFFK